jgi:murein DD-endopeptidase MepM/ murein hydrolase activator NlpD
MTLKLHSKKKRRGFKTRPLHRRKEPHAIHYLTERMTFWIAVLSVLAFVTGNMLGQHGWRVFWKSVLGEGDDSLIVYTGTVPPLAHVPDYRRWSQYGGNPGQHTFSEVPQDDLIALPSYDATHQKTTSDRLYYSVGYMGAYATGSEGDGDHPAVDIRVPVGTPVQSIMNGIVVGAKDDGNGFGKYVVIRHPRVPDPADPSKVTTLFSVYAHLSEIDVSEGETVQKGQRLGLSGQTGDATGPHLHFQIDRQTATDGTTVPYHPFWPFSGMEARLAGMTFNQAIDAGLNQGRGYASTVNPMVYVQSQYAPVQVAAASSASSRKPLTLAEMTAERRAARLAKRGTVVATSVVAIAESSSSAASSIVAAASSSSTPAPVVEQVVATIDPTPPSPPVTTDVTPPAPKTLATRGFSDVDIEHPTTFTGRKWEAITITLLNQDGLPITNPVLDGDIYLMTAYGKAEFRPAVLTSLDFTNGTAQAQMLPLTKTTIVIQVQPKGILSSPMRYEKD